MQKPPVVLICETYVPTLDDWHPNFPRNTVRVRLTERPHPAGHGPTFRISVWGADDEGMEKEIRCAAASAVAGTRDGLRKLVEHGLPNPLNRDWLEAHGFVRV